MNIALVFGARSDNIRKRMTQLRDDLYIDIYQNVDDFIRGSQTRQKTYNRVLILSGVVSEDTDAIFNRLYKYWRSFGASSEFVLFANSGKDDELAKKFNNVMCSPMCTSVLVPNVSIVVIGELTSLSIKDLNTKYGCQEETDLELEYASYDEPEPEPVEQPVAPQVPQKQKGGLLSRLFGKKKGVEPTAVQPNDAQNQEASEVNTTEDTGTYDDGQQSDDTVSAYEEETDYESDSVYEDVGETDYDTDTGEFTPINESDFKQFEEESDYVNTDESSDYDTAEYGVDPSMANSDADQLIDAEDSVEYLGDAISNNLMTDEFSELTTPNFSSDDEFDTEDDFNNDFGDTTEDFEFTPVQSSENSDINEWVLHSDVFEEAEIIDDTTELETDSVNDVQDYESEAISEQAEEDTIVKSFDDTAENSINLVNDSTEDIFSDGISDINDDFSNEGTTETDDAYSAEMPVDIAPDGVDLVSDDTEDLNLSAPTGEEVSDEFSEDDMLISDTEGYDNEYDTDSALEARTIPTVSEQFNFSMPNTVPIQSESPKPQKKKGVLSGLFGKKSKEQVNEQPANNVAQQSQVPEKAPESTTDLDAGEVTYKTVDTPVLPQHPKVKDSDEATIVDDESNLFGDINVAELEEDYREDELAKNTIVERIEVAKDENRAINNILSGKDKRIFLVTGDRGTGVTTFAYGLAQEFAKHTEVLYYDGDTNNHGILNYIDLNRFCEYEDVKQQANKVTKSVSAFNRCVMKYSNNFDLVSSIYGTAVTDTEYETVQSVITDISDKYNVIVADIPIHKLHLCQELITSATVILMAEPTKRGMMNLACTFDSCQLPVRYKRRIVSSGVLMLGNSMDKSDVKKLKKTISDIVGFDEDESNWLSMKTLSRDKITMQFINELLD